MTDGRKKSAVSSHIPNRCRSFVGIQLIHNAVNAASHEDADDGLHFIQEMMDIMKNTNGLTSASSQSNYHIPLSVIPLIDPSVTRPMSFPVGPAQFGRRLHGVPGVSTYLSKITKKQSFSLAVSLDLCSIVRRSTVLRLLPPLFASSNVLAHRNRSPWRLHVHRESSSAGRH